MKVLVVSDDPHIARLVEVNLLRTGNDVVVGYSYDDVERLAIEGKLEDVECVITDADLCHYSYDGANVIDFVRGVYEHPPHKLRFTVMSGYAEDHRRVRSITAPRPFVAYLSKPFHPRDLVQTVTRTI
jgi:CheY-like chemotaxis protein